MASSLRSRLIISYIIVVLLTLLIASAGLLILLQDYQQGITIQRLEAALGPAIGTATSSLREGRSPDQVVGETQDQIDKSWLALIVDDQGAVLADSQHTLGGRTLPRALSQQNLNGRRFISGAQRVGARSLVYAAAPVVRGGQPREFLVLATVERPFLGALQDLAGPLLIAGAVASLLAIVIGLLFANTISGPLGRLTRATEAIARGSFDEQIPARGSDEVARLALSFNSMMRAVKQTQQRQKDFVANVSHELKTPLTSIQGFAQAIAEGTIRDMEGTRRAGQLIYDESQRMARLVADLLTLARFDAGAVAGQQATLDLAKTLPAWVNRFQPRAEQARVSLSVSVDSPPPVEGDPERLEQVVANLIDNAIKYNRPGGRVDVSAGREVVPALAPRGESRKGDAGSKSWAVIRVIDTGLGIPKSHLPRLFDRFYRGDKARLAGGSGLGLSIAQEIVKAHHGRIEVQSSEGRGTTASLWLPGK